MVTAPSLDETGAARAGAQGGTTMLWRNHRDHEHDRRFPDPISPKIGLWTRRLTIVGRTLDARGCQVTDIAICLIDEESLLSGLEWRDGTFYGGWAPIDLKIDTTRAPVTSPLGGSPGHWTFRLGAVGKMLDREQAPLRDVCVLDVDGGLIVQALVATRTGDRLTWHLRTREVANETIAGGRPDRSGGFLTGR
jgi:hypothetical protein